MSAVRRVGTDGFPLRSTHAGTETSELQRLRHFEAEISRLKKSVAKQVVYLPTYNMKRKDNLNQSRSTLAHEEDISGQVAPATN